MDRLRTLLCLRFRLSLHGLRRGPGAANLIGTTILSVLAGLVSLAMAAGCGALIYFLSRGADAETLGLGYNAVFYTFLFFGVLLPIFSGTGGGDLDLARLRLFPVSRRWLYGLAMLSSLGSPAHLLYLPAWLAVGITGLTAPGVRAPAGVLLLALFLAFQVAWGQALLLALQSLMRRRRAREILATVAMLLFVGLSLLPAALERNQGRLAESHAAAIGVARRALSAAARALPPTLAARGLTALHGGDEKAALGNACGLFLWVAAGAGLGYLAFARDPSGRPRRPGARAAAPGRAAEQAIDPGAGKVLLGTASEADHAWTRRSPQADIAFAAVHSPSPEAANTAGWRGLLRLPTEIAAVAEKELRYILRSLSGKMVLVSAPLLTLVFVFIFSEKLARPFFGFQPVQTLLCATLCYTVFLSNNMVNNAYGWEGRGAQAYYLLPAPLRSVVAGKNLGLWLFEALLFVLVIGVWGAATRTWGAGLLLTGALVFASAQLSFTTAGNFVSILFPARRDLASYRSSPSQVGILLSFLSLALSLALVGISQLPALLWGRPGLRPLFLAAVLLLQSALYLLTLGWAARLLAVRKERFLDVLGRRA